MSSTVATSNEPPPAHLINFGCGHPDASLLPVSEIATATQRALVDDNDGGRSWLQYGRENGNFSARQALANFLTTLYQGDVVAPETLCFTSGVSHGVQLTCRTLQRMHLEEQLDSAQKSNTPPLCWVEDPTYFLVPAIFQQSGYELQAVETDPSAGIELTVLEQKIHAARETDPHRLLVLYSIPVHHNPLGISLREEARVKLVDLCEQYSVYLITDEVYHGLSFPETQTFTPMVALRKSPHIISVSAFTKILCPGIRCGWIQTGNLELLRRIGQDGVLDSGGCSSQMSSGIVAQLIQSGTLPSYMTALQTEYAKRCRHLCQLLQAASNSSTSKYQFEFEVPQGGYFLWVRVVGLHFPLDETFRSFCREEHHVDFRLGVTCSSGETQQDPDLTKQRKFLDCMRLCFAYYDTESLTLGVERLCQALEAYPNSQASSVL